MEPVKPKENPVKVPVSKVVVQPKKDDCVSGDSTNRSDKRKNVVVLEKSKTSEVITDPPKHRQNVAMVLDGIRALDKGEGAPAQSVANYIEQNYNVDMNNMKPFMKNFLKKGVQKGILIRVSGKGATGRFQVSLAPKKKRKR